MACQSATRLAVKFKTPSWQNELLNGSHDILACLGVLLLRELEGNSDRLLSCAFPQSSYYLVITKQMKSESSYIVLFSLPKKNTRKKKGLLVDLLLLKLLIRFSAVDHFVYDIAYNPLP